MDHDAPNPSTTPVGRRAILGGLAAGVAAAGLASAKPASAAPVPQLARPGAAVLNATALQDGLSYVKFSGYDFRALASDQNWSSGGGSFAFNDTTNDGYCLVSHNLPIGAVIKEFEVYGDSGAGTSAGVFIWTVATDTGAIANPVTAPIPVSTSNFTVTVPMDIEITAQLSVTPFVFISDSVAGATSIAGARIGYVPPAAVPSFVPISPIPRPYNTRDTAGLTKLNPGEERTITLPVPAGISAAVIQLTVTETGAGGFVGVFPGDAASWPGNSSINWSAVNENVGGTVITAVSTDGKIKLRGGGSPTHVIIDVPGYLT